MPNFKCRAFAFLMCLLCSSTLPAQSIPIEAGVQLTGTHLHKLDQTPLGIGGRVFLEFARGTSLDTEVTHFSNVPATTALFGIKSGLRANRFGIFGKARAGIWHFGGGYSDARLTRKDCFTADIGGVLEYYPSPRTAVRIDLGDTIIFYKSAPLGTVHNFQPGVGFGFRF